MRLATIRTPAGTRAVRIDGDRWCDLGYADVGRLLVQAEWRAIARSGATEPTALIDTADFAPVIPRPGKIICVGLNYRTHILEMGRGLPEYPTLFTKFPEALVGANDDITLPPESDQVDWEAELAVVIGSTVRRADRHQAAAAIAGFTVLNDVTARDWQYRTTQWLQGKTFEHTTPFGPVLVTPDELPGATTPSVSMTASVDGEVVQEADTADLVFSPPRLVEYVSAILTLHPGDVIATGTPGGVGHARTPPRYLAPGSRLITQIDGIGVLDNLGSASRPSA